MSENPDTSTATETTDNPSIMNATSSTNERGGNNNNNNKNWRQRPRQNIPKRNNRQMQNNNTEMDKSFVPRNIIMERLSEISGPTHNLPLIDLNTERKFSGHNRLYLGNLPDEIDENDLVNALNKYGEIGNVFLNKAKHFAFLTMDYKINAERAQNELNQTTFKNKTMKISLAPNLATVKVSNLSNFVTNELLYHSFKIFGDVERAIVLIDEYGNSKCKGFVEFVRKSSAETAIRKCNEECYFLTASLRPCVVESCDLVNYVDGFNEKQIKQDSYQHYYNERQIGPRFARPNSFETDYGDRLKQLHLLYTQKKEALKKEFELELEKVEAQMEVIRYDRETEMLREEIRQRELRRQRQQMEWGGGRDRSNDQRQSDNMFTRRGGNGNQMDQEDFRQQQQPKGNFKRYGGGGGGGESNQSYHNKQNDRQDNQIKFEPPSNVDENTGIISPNAFMNNFYNNQNMNDPSVGNYPGQDKRRRRL